MSMRDESLDVEFMYCIKYIPEVFSGRASSFREIVREVSHELSISLHPIPHLLNAEFFILGNVDILDLFQRKKLLLTR